MLKILVMLACLLLVSCSEVKTVDAAGNPVKPANRIVVTDVYCINGQVVTHYRVQYWDSRSGAYYYKTDGRSVPLEWSSTKNEGC